MRLRRAYGRVNLKTRSEKLKIIGSVKDYCEFCQGYYVRGKKLKTARQFMQYNTEANINNLAFVRYFPNIDTTLAMTTSGQIYRWTAASAGKPFTYSGLVANYYPSAVSCYYKDASVIAVISGSRIVFVKPTIYEICTISYSVRGAAYHKGRLFAVDPSKNCIRWSGTNLSEWKESTDGAGYLHLDPKRGEIFSVIEFGENLIAFREYGLDVIKAFGDPRHFTVVSAGEKLTTEKLTTNTCVECGGKLYFASTDNIYCYNGEIIEKIELPEYMKASFYSNGRSEDGRYVFFYCTPKNSSKSCQFELDTVTGECAFFAPEIPFLWKRYDYFYGWKNNTVYKQHQLTGYDMPCVWRTGKIDAGTAGVKTLKSIYVNAKDEARIAVTADGVKRELKGRGRIHVGMSGREFVFELNGKNETGLLEAEWEVRA